MRDTLLDTELGAAPLDLLHVGFPPLSDFPACLVSLHLAMLDLFHEPFGRLDLAFEIFFDVVRVHVVHETLYVVQLEASVSWISAIGNIDGDSGLGTCYLAAQWTRHHLFVNRVVDQAGAFPSIACVDSLQVLEAVVILGQGARVLEVFLGVLSFAPLFLDDSIPVDLLAWRRNIRSLRFLLLLLDSPGQISLPVRLSCLLCLPHLDVGDSLVDLAFLLLFPNVGYGATIAVAEVAEQFLAFDRLVILKQGNLWILLGKKFLIFFKLLVLESC